MSTTIAVLLAVEAGTDFVQRIAIRGLGIVCGSLVVVGWSA